MATTTTEAALVSFDLLSPLNHDQGVPLQEDESYLFDGSAALKLTNHGPKVGTRFSIAIDMVQTPGTQGYIFAKSDVIGNRWFSLYTTQSSNRVYFFYRVAGSTTVNFVRFAYPLNDGKRHRLLVSVHLTDITLIVDRQTVRNRLIQLLTCTRLLLWRAWRGRHVPSPVISVAVRCRRSAKAHPAVAV